MSVNSALKRFFGKRLMMPAAFTIMLTLFFFKASSFTTPSDRDLRAKQANLIVREIGHRLLLQSNDFTSRVLPVTEVKAGIFKLMFEKEFVFNHDSLMMLAHRLFPKAQFPSGYTVTVYECFSSTIVYGFQTSNISPDILACQGRREPSGCYSVEVMLPDLFEVSQEKKAEIGADKRESKTLKEDRPAALEDAEASKELRVTAEDQQPKLAELTASSSANNELSQKVEAAKENNFDFPSMNVIFSGVLVLAGATLLVGRFGKMLKPVEVKTEEQPTAHEPVVPEGSPLGKFVFDVKDQRLLLENEVISLTEKECKVLELLNESFGELIPRDTLMQKIWISEGVITGRSLDMFVSKLRKKLSADPGLKITNVHGRGYKLEMVA